MESFLEPGLNFSQTVDAVKLLMHYFEKQKLLCFLHQQFAFFVNFWAEIAVCL